MLVWTQLCHFHKSQKLLLNDFGKLSQVTPFVSVGALMLFRS